MLEKRHSQSLVTLNDPTVNRNNQYFSRSSASMSLFIILNLKLIVGFLINNFPGHSKARLRWTAELKKSRSLPKVDLLSPGAAWWSPTAPPKRFHSGHFVHQWARVLYIASFAKGQPYFGDDIISCADKFCEMYRRIHTGKLWPGPPLGTLPKKKNGKMWEFFPSGGPPPPLPPVWEPHVCEKKLWFILHFRT